MRMWMINPKFMCRKHLLGEHVELHMFVGTIQKKKSLNGYVKHNCVYPSMIRIRHRHLIEEMSKCGYRHKSILPEYSLNYLPEEIVTAKVKFKKSLQDLMCRCDECFYRFIGLEKVI